jgi:hypothetical protein
MEKMSEAAELNDKKVIKSRVKNLEFSLHSFLGGDCAMLTTIARQSR